MIQTEQATQHYLDFYQEELRIYTEQLRKSPEGSSEHNRIQGQQKLDELDHPSQLKSLKGLPVYRLRERYQTLREIRDELLEIYRKTGELSEGFGV